MLVLLMAAFACRNADSNCEVERIVCSLPSEVS